MINEYYRDLEKINNVLFCLMMLSFLLFLVSLANKPEELENGCISYNDGIYCEEVSK